MKNFFKLSLFLLFVGCNIPYFSQNSHKKETVIATVGNNTLTDSQLLEEMHRGASLESRYKYVREWVDRALYSEVAIDNGMNKTDFFNRKVEDFKRDLLASMYRDSVEKSLSTLAISESEIKSYYNLHKSELILSEDKIKIEAITVDNGKKAWEILRMLRPSNFHKLSKRYSITPTVSLDDLPYTNKSDLDKSVSDYLFTIKNDGITPPKKIGGQYLIFHIIDKRLAGSQATYVEVKSRVHSAVLANKVDEEFAKGVDKLKSRDDYYFNRDYFSSVEKISIEEK